MAQPPAERTEQTRGHSGHPSAPNWVAGDLHAASEGLGLTIEDAAENARARMKRGEDDKEGDEDLITYYYTVMQYRSREGRQRKPRTTEVRRSDGWGLCLLPATCAHRP